MFPCCGPEMWCLVPKTSDLYEMSTHGRLRAIGARAPYKPFINKGCATYKLARSQPRTTRTAWSLFCATFLPQRTGGVYEPRDGDRGHICRNNCVFVARGKAATPLRLGRLSASLG